MKAIGKNFGESYKFQFSTTLHLIKKFNKLPDEQKSLVDKGIRAALEILLETNNGQRELFVDELVEWE